MNLMSKLLRRAPAAVVAVAAIVLGACGGGVETDPFVPTRLVVFGDELSVLEDIDDDANARKYTVNALKEDKVTRDCVNNAIWVQHLGNHFGLVMPQCNPMAVVSPPSRNYAAPDARIAQITAQIDEHFRSGGGFGEKDLVTVLGGTNDVIDIYGNFLTEAARDPQNPDHVKAARDAAIDAARAAGNALGQQVTRIAKATGKVVISTLPDLGVTPFALAQNLLLGGTGPSALLSELSNELNTELRLALPNDSGRYIGLVLLNESVQYYAKNPSGFVNVTDAACDVTKAPQVQDCTSLTLVQDGAAATYMWADRLWLSPGMHAQLGSLAITRATSNPF
jgi:hypothetical protein